MPALLACLFSMRASQVERVAIPRLINLIAMMLLSVSCNLYLLGSRDDSKLIIIGAVAILAFAGGLYTFLNSQF